MYFFFSVCQINNKCPFLFIYESQFEMHIPFWYTFLSFWHSVHHKQLCSIFIVIFVSDFWEFNVYIKRIKLVVGLNKQVDNSKI